ncbi:MAG: ImmA/IrrE family metallo-endopeptidase, partial [Candidatus Saccharimonadales bacterium]
MNAQEWIDKYRVEHSDGSLDMFGTVDRVGIPLASVDEKYESDPIVTKAYIKGVHIDADEAIRIHISPRNEEDQARFSLGHELGHFFLFQQGYTHDDSVLNPSAEQFCDFFGRELALPSGYL